MSEWSEHPSAGGPPNHEGPTRGPPTARRRIIPEGPPIPGEPPTRGPPIPKRTPIPKTHLYEDPHKGTPDPLRTPDPRRPPHPQRTPDPRRTHPPLYPHPSLRTPTPNFGDPLIIPGDPQSVEDPLPRGTHYARGSPKPRGFPQSRRGHPLATPHL